MESNFKSLPRQFIRAVSHPARVLVGRLVSGVSAIAILVAASLSSAGDVPLTFESSETPEVLVELYTSEGCSSCPPADAWLSGLKNSPDLWRIYVPVAFHVDYWNRLGWTDRFSSPEFSARQRRYAILWGVDSVYTPELALNGREWQEVIVGLPLPAPASVQVGKLKVTLRGATRADIVFTPTGKGLKPSQVEVALLGTNLESDVKRGENGGRKLRHDFVVLKFVTAKLTEDAGRYSASVAIPISTTAEPTALAAWVTSGESLQPIQTVGGWIKSPQ
jgi:hypothetical protein